MSFQSESISAGAFRRIQSAIVCGELPPGSAISEPQLARTYGISQGPLRDVLQRLEEQRLLVRHPRAGASVVALSEAELVELYDIRESLEGTACRLAAERMSDRAIAALRVLLDRPGPLRIGEAPEENLDFHYRIIQGCGNRALVKMLCGELYPLLRMYRLQLNAAAGTSLQADDDHLAIVDAIERRDGERAEQLMRRHIAAGKRLIAEHFRVATCPSIETGVAP